MAVATKEPDAVTEPAPAGEGSYADDDEVWSEIEARGAMPAIVGASSRSSICDAGWI